MPRGIYPGNKFGLGIKPWNKGKSWSQEVKDKISKRHLESGYKPVKPFRWTGKKRPKFSKEWKENLSRSHTGKTKEKSSNWKGGITPINQQIRHSEEYINWRKMVFERDDYRCMDCGERGNKLEADHIYRFIDYPRLRFDVNNGQTLCENCHRQKTVFESKTGIYKIYTDVRSAYLTT